METKKLNSYEQTSYWWITMLRSKVEELFLYQKMIGTLDPSELEFLNLFRKFSDKDWRPIYLELKKYIAEDVRGNTPDSNMCSFNMDAFNQDTDIVGHQRLNEELGAIMGVKFPNIRLANKGRKDSVIYTDSKNAYVWYKSYVTEKLPKEYDSSYNYVITGNKKELDFNNLVLSTLIAIKKKNTFFDDMNQLRILFCENYRADYGIESFTEVIDNFNLVLSALYKKGLNISRFWDDEFSFMVKELDKNGLESYQVLADYYSNEILGIDSSKELKEEVMQLRKKKNKYFISKHDFKKKENYI